MAPDISAPTVLPVSVVPTWKLSITAFRANSHPRMLKLGLTPPRHSEEVAEMLPLTRNNARNNGATVPVSSPEEGMAHKHLRPKGLH